MFDDKIIESIAKKVCEDNKEVYHIFPNGNRVEGYSFIVTRMLYSYVVDDMIKAINEAFPEENNLGEWRIHHCLGQLPCKGVKEEEFTETLELRLMWAKKGN